MKRKNFAALLLIVTIVLAVVAGCGNDNDDVIPQDDSVGKTRSYLFVQNGKSGTFVGNGDGNYTLTIDGVSSQTIYFSDRPERDAGQIDMQTYLNSGCFNETNPPNAAIDVLNGEEGNDVVIVELLNPVYDSNAATLQYTARILEDVNHSVVVFNEKRDGSIPTSFGSVALFIDDCSDITVKCGDWAGGEAGTVSCCTCWKFPAFTCDFHPDCCSFEQCQNTCINKYTIGNRYLQAGDGTWVESYESWKHHGGPDPSPVGR